MTVEAIHPGLLLIAAGLALPFAGPLRSVLLLGAPLAAMWIVSAAADGTYFAFDYAGFALEPLRYDATTRIFAFAFTIAIFAAALFGWAQVSRMELAAALTYAGAALGVVLAGDLVTLFVFWEAMAIAATVIVWCGGPAGRRAGLRYAAIHFFGGVLLMAGMAGEAAATGSIAFDAFALDSPARWLMLAGILVNAGAWPLSAWVADAYPSASWSGMVFLSAFTTKAAVYALMRGFPGAEPLIFVGLLMIVYGLVYAILENDMRRMLAYSLVSQVGFMVTGVGIGSEMALNGVAALAFVHVVYEALLLMAAGAVLYRTGARDFTGMGGLWRTMPFTAGVAAVGALSLSAAPLTSGFVSKSMIITAASYGGMRLLWVGLVAASAATALYAAFAFLWFGFFEGRPERVWATRAAPGMGAAMALTAAISIYVGVWPEPLYALLPFPVKYVPYTDGHVLSQLQLITAAGVVFFVFIGFLARRPEVTLDVDWLWRGERPRKLVAAIRMVLRGTRDFARRYSGPGLRFAASGLRAAAARDWTTGAMAFWAIVLLLVVVVANYVRAGLG